MANVGVTFDFAAESAKLRSEIDKVRKELSSINAAAKGIKDGFKLVGGVIAGAFSIGAITGFLSKVNQATAQLADLSVQLQASASGLQVLQVAAQQTGGSAEGMNTALAKMSATLGDALAGNKQAAAAFNSLGLSLKELSALKADEAFAKVADATSQLGNSFERANVSKDIFGKGWMQISGVLSEGTSAIDAANAALAEQGALLSDLDVAKIDLMNDSLALQGTIVSNLGVKFLSGLSPAVNVAVDALGNMLKTLGGASEAGQGFGVIMVAAIKTVESVVYAAIAAFEGLRAIISGVLFVVAKATYMEDFAASMDDISTRATANAKTATAAAIQSGLDVARAGAIFAQYSADLDRQAAEAAKRASGAQGAVMGSGAGVNGETAAQKAKRLADEDKAMLANMGRTSLVLNDPVSDPRYQLEESVGTAINELVRQQQAEKLAMVTGSNQMMLDSFLQTGELIQDVEIAKTQTLGQTFQDLVGFAAQQTGAMGKVGKAYAIAQTIWSTGTAIMKAMAEIPFPGNLGVAAMVAAKGALQLASIRKTNIGSGGSIATGGSSIGSSASMPDRTNGTVASTESQEKSATQVIINGNVFSSQETVDWMIEQISAAVNNRDLVFISGNSRQAMELAA